MIYLDNNATTRIDVRALDAIVMPLFPFAFVTAAADRTDYKSGLAALQIGVSG